MNSVSHAPTAVTNMQSNVITSGEKKKVFVTGSGNIEVTQVSQPITHPLNVPNITPNITSNVSASNGFLFVVVIIVAGFRNLLIIVIIMICR